MSGDGLGLSLDSQPEEMLKGGDPTAMLNLAYNADSLG
jgi:hypothetical protein